MHLMAIAYSLVRVRILYRTHGCGIQTCQVFRDKNGEPPFETPPYEYLRKMSSDGRILA